MKTNNRFDSYDSLLLTKGWMEALWGRRKEREQKEKSHVTGNSRYICGSNEKPMAATTPWYFVQMCLYVFVHMVNSYKGGFNHSCWLVCALVCLLSDPQPTHPTLSIYLSPCLPCLWWLFVPLLPGPEKRRRFFSWETLGEVCCSVSREWEWNPVFLGLVSLPVLRSHHRLVVTIGIVSGLAAVLGNSRLFSLSRILGFWLYTAPALYFTLPLLLLSYITFYFNFPSYSRIPLLHFHARNTFA